MPNPFGYGDTITFPVDHAGFTGLFPSQWVNEAMRLSQPMVYFPSVTPVRTEFETPGKQNIIVPLEGEMQDTSWPGLTSGTSISLGSYNLDAVTVQIAEAGRGLSVERVVKQYLANGLYPGEAQNFVRKLTNNFAISWENTLRSVYLNTQWGIYSVAQGSFSSLKSDIAGTGLFTVAGTITDLALDAVVTEFKQVHTGTLGTFIVQPYSDGLYRMVGNFKTLKYLLREPNYVSLQTRNQALAGGNMIYQVFGQWGGFQIIEHNLMPDGTVICHGRNVAVQAFGGGFDTYGIPEQYRVRTTTEGGIPFDIRYEPNKNTDFYRDAAIAWYVLAGSAAALRDIGTHCIRLHVA